MENSFVIDEPFKKGLRSDADEDYNTNRLVLARNLRTGKYGMRQHETISDFVSSAELSSNSVTIAHPFPQIFRGKNETLLCDETKIFTVNETTGVLTQLTTYDWNSQASTKNIASGGGPWHFVDMRENWVLFNGSETVIRMPDIHATRIYVDDTVTINSGCVFRGRLLTAGFDATDYWSADWQTFLNGLGTLDGMVTNSIAGLDNNWVHWSLVGASNGLLPLMNPDDYFATTDELIPNGEFDAATGWTLGGTWAIANGVLTGTTEEDSEDATITAPADTFVDDGYYYYRFKLTLTSGKLTLKLGGNSQLTTTTPVTDEWITGIAFLQGGVTSQLAGFYGSTTSPLSCVIGQFSVKRLSDDMIFTFMQQDTGGMPMDWQETVQAIKPLEDGVVVYGGDGVSGLVPEFEGIVGFGLKERLHTSGLANRGAVGGNLDKHFFVDENGVAFLIEKGGFKKTRLGYEEFLADMIGNNITVSYDEDQDTFYICDGVETYLWNPEHGLSEHTRLVNTVLRVDGGLAGIVEDGLQSATLFQVETQFSDLGFRGLKNIHFVQMDSVDFTAVTIKVQYIVDGTTYITGDIYGNERGQFFAGVSGEEFRFIIKGTAAANAKISYLRAHFHFADNRANRGPRG